MNRLDELFSGHALADILQDLFTPRLRTDINHAHSVFVQLTQLLRRFMKHIGSISVYVYSPAFREQLLNFLQNHQELSVGQA